MGCCVKAVEKRGTSTSSVAIEKSHLTVERLERMTDLFNGATFHRLDEKLNSMRVIKNDEELANLRIAAELADYAIEVGCREIAEGKTELEILMAIEFEMKKKDVQKMSFETMVLSGPKTASPHGVPGDRKIQQGDFVLFDLGVVYNGYCSDITRTVAFGEPTAAQREIYETVRKAEQAAVDLVRPGVQAKEIDAAARNVIDDAGFGEYPPEPRLGSGSGPGRPMKTACGCCWLRMGAAGVTALLTVAFLSGPVGRRPAVPERPGTPLLLGGTRGVPTDLSRRPYRPLLRRRRPTSASAPAGRAAAASTKGSTCWLPR